MPKDAHSKAAEHHENAAKSHKMAAEHHGRGDHTKGQEEFRQSPVAFEDRTRALRHGDEKSRTAK